MSSPIVRLTDMHVCPMQTPAVVPIPHVGGPVSGPGAMTVLAGGLPVCVVGDFLDCVGPPDVAAMGSTTVLAMGRPVVRVLDPTAHGGVYLVGLPTVLVGDASSPGQQSSTPGAGASSMSTSEGPSSAPEPTSSTTASTSSSADSAPQSSATATAVSAPWPITGKAWIEVEVIDLNGAPLPYRHVTVTDAGGTERTTFSDAKGMIRIDGITPGDCKITLPDLDQSSWKPA
jgi:uncharacterized Zn-binding protein involved in type VI secretion